MKSMEMTCLALMVCHDFQMPNVFFQCLLLVLCPVEQYNGIMNIHPCFQDQISLYLFTLT